MRASLLSLPASINRNLSIGATVALNIASRGQAPENEKLLALPVLSTPFGHPALSTASDQVQGPSVSNPSSPDIYSPQLIKVRGYVKADSLSEYDYSYEDPARATSEDTLEPLPHVSEISSHDFFTLHPMTAPRRPKFPRLHRQLQSLIDQDPTPSLDTLLRFHESAPPQKRSTRSYNIMLRLAVRNASFHTVSFLLQSMVDADISGDEHTLKYMARSLVRQGRWEDAFDLATRGSDGVIRTRPTLDGIHPLVWAELFGGAQRGAIRRRDGEGGSRPVAARSHGISPGQFFMNLRHLPRLTSTTHSVERPQKSTIYLFVRALLRMGEHRAAMDITLRLLRARPTVWGIRFVHLHIALIGRSPMPKPGLKRFNASYRDLDAMLHACPTLRPDATTLFILLGHLKDTFNCGTLGQRLLSRFRAKWGEDVVNRAVRSRMLLLARKQGHRKLTGRYIQEIRTARDLKSTTSGRASRSRLNIEGEAVPSRTMYLRDGAERVRSRRVVRKVRR